MVGSLIGLNLIFVLLFCLHLEQRKHFSYFQEENMATNLDFEEPTLVLKHIGVTVS